MDTTGAAITRQHYAAFNGGKPFPRMAWPSNYNRYAAATMFSLFFGGKTYAPDLSVGGENIQDWLQGCYFAAFRHCYRRLKSCKAIVGWGVMNEPYNCFLGHKDLKQTDKPVMPTGPRPSPWNTIRAASGYATVVPVYNDITKKSSKNKLFNPGSHSLFKSGYTCPWKQAGVWTDEDGDPRLLRKDHFALYEGRQVDIMEDFHRPFMLRFIETMRKTDEHTFFFIEGRPLGTGDAEYPSWKKDDPPNVINAFHWYDGFALFTKQFRPWFTIDPGKAKLVIGKKKAQDYFNKCVEDGVKWAREHMRDIPSLLGEFGLAFDMNKRRAFSDGNYSLHEEALSMYYNAVDENLIHSTLWNYTADNTNESGDGWNDEDLSIFSEGKERAIAGWKRPYPMATAGQPLAIKWDHQQCIFSYRFNADGSIEAPTIIYLPAEWFGLETKIKVASAGMPLHFEYREDEQRLLVFNGGFSGEVGLVVSG
jgi:hypothetical protein